MATSEEVIINTVLAGSREFAANADLEAASVGRLGEATAMTGRRMEATTRRSFAMNQALFTMRRVAYGGTLALIAAGVEALRMGFNFDKGMQVARVSMKGFLPSTQAINDELNKLYNFAAYTPFQFQDIVLATRRLVPFVHNIGEANDLIASLVNGLSAMGITTASALNRGSIALAHMLSSGRVTGMALNQLTRDNIPLLSALAAHYHVTTEEIRQMVSRGLIPATVGAQALNEYIARTPGYAGAAARIATQSLAGAWTTFKDIIMKSFGSAEGGLFSGIQHMLQGVDLALAPLLKGGKPITIYDLVKAFDQQLSPSSHVVINTFELLNGIMQGLIFEFHYLGVVITGLLYPLHLFGSGTSGAEFTSRLLGYALSSIIFLWLGYRTGMMLATLATEAWVGVTKLARVAVMLYEIWILRAEYAQMLFTKAQVIATTVTFWLQWWQLRAAESTLLMTLRMRAAAVAIVLWNAGIGLATLVTGGFTTAVGLLTTAIYAIPLIGWILLAITALVVLYFKWKAFHDAVNGTVQFLYNNPLVAFFVPVIGPIIVTIRLIAELVRHFQDLVHWAKDAAHWISQAAGGHFGGHGGGGWLGTALGFGAKVINPLGPIGFGMSFLADGGTVTHAGLAMVGERGPELLHLPRGAQVQPLMHNFDVGGGMARVIQVVIKPWDLILDGKRIATATAEAVTDADARL